MSAVHPIVVPPAVRYGRWVAFAAAAALAASGEYQLAELAGWPWYVAWLLPVALDVYAYSSFATRRRADTLAALALMVCTNAAYHLAATGNIPAGWRLVVLVAALPPVICWRVHRLGEQPERSTNVPVGLNAAPDVQPSAPKPEPVAEVPERPTLTPEPPAVRKLTAVPAERKQRQEVRADVRRRRPAEETRRLAEELLSEDPELTRRAVADRLGISDRQLRSVLNAQQYA